MSDDIDSTISLNLFTPSNKFSSGQSQKKPRITGNRVFFVMSLVFATVQFCQFPVPSDLYKSD